MSRRSLLFSPGDKPDLMRKAPGSDADVICFDLEDAVAPGRKDAAREAVAELLADPDFDPGAEVCVRLTATDPAADLDALVGAAVGDDAGSAAGDDAGSAAGDDAGSAAGDDAGSAGGDDAGSAGGDDAETADPRFDAVMLPKVESADRVEAVAAMCAERGVDPAVFALIETAAGVLSAESIAAAEPTAAVLFGAEDLAADLGAVRTDEGEEVSYARQHVVLAASAAGVDAIDTVFTDFSDDEGLRADAERAVTLGYDGKMAIHPAQVPVINDAYTPDSERIEWAEAVLDAREAADLDERGVFEVDGEMIDAPLVAQAERVLERARAADLR